MLEEVLIGFGEVYAGYCTRFLVEEAMIGFTPEGEARVWLNPDFSLNRPRPAQFNRPVEPSIIESILNAIGIHLPIPWPPSLRACESFETSLKEVRLLLRRQQIGPYSGEMHNGVGETVL